jgi:hypothetical protein
MPAKITNGFPLRRCSWFFNPIVSDALGRKMIRSLDLVCLQQVTLKLGACSYLEEQQAPQKEIDRQKGEADKLEAARLKNVKAFRPWHWSRTGIFKMN